MARKLSDLMLRNDVDGKQLRCLIVEDYKTGSVAKYRDRQTFEELIAQTDEMFLTKIYEPTAKERENLLKVLQSHHVEGETSVNIPEEVVLFTMLQFTDLEFDTTDFEENKDLLQGILANPNPLFMSIKNELDLIFIESLAMLIDTQDAYRHLPEEWLELSNAIQEVHEDIQTQNKKIKTQKKKVKKLQKQVDEEFETLGESVREIIQ